MTKAELIEDVSRAVEMSRKDSETIVETIFESRKHRKEVGTRAGMHRPK